MKSKVLLIDDSVTIHRVIDLSIDFDRYDIVKVFSKEDAALKLQSEQFDYVLLDNKLDNIVISDYISELKAQQPSSSVILLVGAFDRFEEKDLEKSGADDYLVKPFDSQSLNAKLTSDANIMPEGLVEKIAEADQARDNDSFIAAAPVTAEHSAEKKITKEEYLDNLEETLPDDMTETGYADDDEKKESGGSPEERVDEPAAETVEDEPDIAPAPVEDPVPAEENIGVNEEEAHPADTDAETAEASEEVIMEDAVEPETDEIPADEESGDILSSNDDAGVEDEAVTDIPDESDETPADIPADEEPLNSDMAEEETAPLEETAADIEPAADEILPEVPADTDDNIDIAEEIDTLDEESVSDELLETAEESAGVPIEEEPAETVDTDDDSAGVDAGEIPSDNIDEVSESETAADEPVLPEEIADEEPEMPADITEPDISDEAAAEPETEQENAPLFDDDDWLNDAPAADTLAKPIQDEPIASETVEESVETVELLPEETLSAEDEIAEDIPEQIEEAVASDDEAAADEILPEIPADTDDNIDVAEETDTPDEENVSDELPEIAEESEAAPIEDETVVEMPDTDDDIADVDAGEMPSDNIDEVSEAETAADEPMEAEDIQEQEAQEDIAPVMPVSPQGLPDVKEADVIPEEPAPARFGGITVTISRDEIMSMLGNAIDKHFLEEAVKEVLARNMQDIVRNIVPAIAEKYIKEEIERLKNDE